MSIVVFACSNVFDSSLENTPNSICLSLLPNEDHVALASFNYVYKLSKILLHVNATCKQTYWTESQIFSQWHILSLITTVRDKLRRVTCIT